MASAERWKSMRPEAVRGLLDDGAARGEILVPGGRIDIELSGHDDQRFSFFRR